MIDYWAVQRALKAKGFDPGPIDGDLGPKTEKAIIAFKKSVGLLARPYLGPITLGMLLKDRPAPPAVSFGEPAWLRMARQEIGVREIAGVKHSARVLWYWAKSKLGFTDDETPWCAGFVGAILEESGIVSTRSGMARSYSKWGIKLDKAIPGAVVVFWRGSKSGASGHVGFYVAKDQYGNIMVLGGNQSNAVSIAPFSTDRVLGYYWPMGVPIPGQSVVEVIKSTGQVSQNEA